MKLLRPISASTVYKGAFRGLLITCPLALLFSIGAIF